MAATRLRVLSSALAAVVVAATAVVAPAAAVEHVPGSSGTSQNWNIGDAYLFQEAQTFTETLTGQVGTVRLVLQDASPLGQTPLHEVVVELRDGGPTGTVLAVSQPVELGGGGANAVSVSPYTSLNVTYFWFEFAFTTPVPVVASTMYTIVVRQVTPSSCWAVTVCAMPAGPNNPAYADGVH